MADPKKNVIERKRPEFRAYPLFRKLASNIRHRVMARKSSRFRPDKKLKKKNQEKYPSHHSDSKFWPKSEKKRVVDTADRRFSLFVRKREKSQSSLLIIAWYFIFLPYQFVGKVRKNDAAILSSWENSCGEMRVSIYSTEEFEMKERF